MSLAVAQIHGNRISIVADTKITYANDESRSRRVYENALPKVVIIRRELCVAFAGNDPEGLITALTADRTLSRREVTDVAVGLPHASFLIASLEDPPVLIEVDAGEVHDRTDVGRAWAGSRDAYEIFRTKEAEWPPHVDDVDFILMSSMQSLTSFGQVSSVGGFDSLVRTTEKGFQFSVCRSVVGPEQMNGIISLDGDELCLSLTPIAGVDLQSISIEGAVGHGSTFGALAYFLNPPGLAILFPHDSPAAPEKLRVKSLTELIEWAEAEFGQHLTA